jgi:Ser/Thr protein kinase RdoA (MazF antagonist)
MSVPNDVLDAFGVQGLPVRLAGGEERTYRAGDIVLRRENATEIPDAEFAAELFVNIVETHDFRVPRPLHTRQGTWITSDGWAAWTFVEGRSAGPDDAPMMAGAIEAFHRAIAALPCPAYLRDRSLVYDRADRGAFGDLPRDVDVRVRPTLETLWALKRPLIGLTDQVIHGDANAANVLIAPGLPPAIIDLAPYWRPPEFALAIAALWLCAYQGHVEAFAAFEHAREFDQLLLRALIRTLLVMDGFGGADRLAEYRPSIETVRGRLAH